MAKSRYVPDRGLTARMGLTMFLLGLLYVVLMAVLIGLGLGYGLVAVIAVVGIGAQWYFSDRIALYAMHGKVVSPAEAPELHGIVDRLCAMADMPKPIVAIADTDVPNAFATGRTPSRAVVCATTGIMRRLDERELEGVLAHELSHVAHRDVTVMTIASVVGVLAGFMTRMVLWTGMGRGRRDNNGTPVVLIVILVSAVVYALSFILTRALSRYRELAADRAGAFLTSQPSALASALTKISGEMARIPSRDLREAEPYNAFFFAPALAPGFSLSSLFSTHPSLERRLEQLGEISAQLGRPTT
ncbi:MAG: heat shock protein HtpX [Actinomycetota bacterium]|jgi:heat shock protein HtpX|nr:heat shock protein HtpX [Actinomycetota bacterium]